MTTGSRLSSFVVLPIWGRRSGESSSPLCPVPSTTTRRTGPSSGSGPAVGVIRTGTCRRPRTSSWTCGARTIPGRNRRRPLFSRATRNRPRYPETWSGSAASPYRSRSCPRQTVARRPTPRTPPRRTWNQNRPTGWMMSPNVSANRKLQGLMRLSLLLRIQLSPPNLSDRTATSSMLNY